MPIYRESQVSTDAPWLFLLL